MKKINITFCSFPDFAGNAKALYEYIIKKNVEHFNLVWIVYEESSCKKLNSMGIKAILIGTDEFKEYIPKTDIFFTTQGNLDGDKTETSLYIELWHGIGPKPVGFACKNPSAEDVRGYNNMRKIFDYVITPSDFWNVIFSTMLHVECKRIKSLGMPLFDYFVNSDGKGNLSKVLKTDVNKYKKIMMYMPTYKKGFNHNDVENVNTENVFNFEKYNENELDEYLKKNNYLLCVKRHPGDKTQYIVKESENIKNINDAMLLEQDLSVNEIINAFDLMITDYSSIGTEFLFLKRPVLYALGDYDEYNENRGIYFSNIDFWTAGPKAINIKQLIEESYKLLNDKNYYEKEREEKYELWFSNLTDGGCDNIYNYFFDENNYIRKEIIYHKDPEVVLEKKLKEIEKQNNQISDKLNGKMIELDLVYNSKGWRFLEKMRSIKGIFKSKK